MDRVKEVYNITTLEELSGVLNTTSISEGRALRDTYAESLAHTNVLLTQLFGNDERKVPAHMPHFMNKEVLQKIEDRIPDQFTDTRSHRFRNSTDLQYALMYFYFLKHFEKEKKDQYYDSLWSQYLDTDHNGYLDKNELATLATMVYDENVNEEFDLKCGQSSIGI